MFGTILLKLDNENIKCHKILIQLPVPSNKIKKNVDSQ